MKDGLATLTSLVYEASSGATLADMEATTAKMKTFASAQVALTSIYTASPCTQAAWDLYKTGMGQMARGTDAMLAWLTGGGIGPLPSEEFVASKTTLTAAVQALKTTTC